METHKQRAIAQKAKRSNKKKQQIALRATQGNQYNPRIKIQVIGKLKHKRGYCKGRQSYIIGGELFHDGPVIIRDTRSGGPKSPKVVKL
ncbi:hypothetical protein BCU25_018895 [Vibrio cyclitrophicus]|nr:hypothetical protein [Vibrio cyclitrophicus]PMJ32764.1 hypothetical protein BCU25_12760 [Vibrio cyclitrophicus]